MKTNKTYSKIVGVIFLSLGILLGFIICSVMVWGDLEASFFTNGIKGDKTLKNIKCPVLITPEETGTVSLILKNPADQLSDRYLRAFISQGYASLVRETKTKVPLPPNGKQKVEWKVFPEDAAYKRVILFRVFMNAKYPYPSMSGNCGIVRINIPWLRGDQVLIIASVLSFGSMLFGIALIETAEKRTTHTSRSWKNSLYFLAGTLVFCSLLSYLGFWLAGLAGLVVAIILLGVIIFRR